MIICKICNPELEGNGYCAEHSTGNITYLEPQRYLDPQKSSKKKEIKKKVRFFRDFWKSQKPAEWEEDGLNNFCYVNAVLVERIDGALRCKITKRALEPFLKSERERIQEWRKRIEEGLPKKVKVHPCNCCTNPDNMSDKRCPSCFCGDGFNACLEQIKKNLLINF